MAKMLKSFQFVERSRRTTSYKWAEWFNGSPWELEHGKDYTVATDAFRATVSSAARSRGLRVRLQKTATGCVIQVFRQGEGG